MIYLKIKNEWSNPTNWFIFSLKKQKYFLFFPEIPEIPVYVDEQVAQINDPAAEILKVDLPDTNFHPIELYWENITVSAKIKEKKGPCKSRKYIKTILDKVKGKASPGTFSAILGPSGCQINFLLI